MSLRERIRHRRLANTILVTAANSMGLTRLEFGKRLMDGDVDAAHALAIARGVHAVESDVDWEAILEMILQIIELLMLFL